MTGDPTRDHEHTERDFATADVPWTDDDYVAAREHDRLHSIKTGRQLINADWLITHGDDLLHHATITDDQALAIVDEAAITAINDGITLACGQVVGWVAVPGLGDRMGLVRCATCCDAVGLPYGKQSPKNDPACHPVPLAGDKEDT